MLPFGKNLSWKSCSMELICLHAGRFCEHPLAVFEAVLKFSRRLLSSPAECYFLPEHHLSPLKSGRTYRLRLVFPSASEKEIHDVQHAAGQWLADPRNHFSVRFGEIVHENIDSALASLPACAEEELALDFLSPLNLPERMQLPDGAVLQALFLDRLEKVFGPLSLEKTLHEAFERLRILPYMWEYREYRHSSKSSGGTQFLNGFQGRLVLCGELTPLLPLIAACTRTGCGSRLSFGLGAIHPMRADLLRQEWTSETALFSSLQFLNAHGYTLDEGCVFELKEAVQSGASLSSDALLLAQEAFLRLVRKPVKLAFPLSAARSSAEFSWQMLKQSSSSGEAGVNSLLSLLSRSDRQLEPLILKVWTLEGVPQMRELQTRIRAGNAVKEAVSFGLDVALTSEGITLGSPADREAMLDLLARQGILMTEETEEEDVPEEGERLTPWRRNLHILHPGATVGLDGDAVFARFDGEVLLRTPLGQISALILHGSGSVSTPLMRRCMAENIPIVLCESGGRLTGSIVPQSATWRKRGRDHALHWEQLGEKGRLLMAKEIIAAKVENFLCRMPRSMRNRRHFQSAGQKALEAIRNVQSSQELLGAEGAFAHVAFRAYNDCVLNETFHSSRREPRSRRDLWNVALDMASFLTFQRIAMELIAEGLDPFLGILHCQNLRYMTFAADIQELFRADVERWLLRMVNQNMLREEHFTQEEGRFKLSGEGRRLFLVEWEAGMQTKFPRQPDSPARCLSRQVRTLRLWLCSGLPPELYTGTGWRTCRCPAFTFS